jgi:hypothetical protein
MPDTSAHLLYGLIAFWSIIFGCLFVMQRKISKLENNLKSLQSSDK